MSSTAVSILIGLLVFAVFWALLFVVVRAATISALRNAGANLAHSNAMLSAQVDLSHRLTKHLIAQSELMLITAKHEGITDDQLAGVIKQIDERKADPAPAAAFFENPYK